MSLKLSCACRFAITVQTGDLPGASTTANVYLRVQLENEELQEVQLSRNADDFRRGMLQNFEVQLCGIGPVISAWLGHDDFGVPMTTCMSKLTTGHRVTHDHA
jgi:hypothetical protein